MSIDNQIKKEFINYFRKLKHDIIDSSSLIPESDSSLLFTNSGMVQFKNIFLGLEIPKNNKVASIQRCVRLGGKHNDINNIGHTTRHSTFFEMLGNFSFGNYFKYEAIHYAWDFLINILSLSKDRILVTVHTDDNESEQIWKEDIKISPNQIVRSNIDNFWSIGQVGLCGPCTEIFYNCAPSISRLSTDQAVNFSSNYIELWNLVFIQFNRDNNGILHNLPYCSVDTGMGLERISSVLQGVYDIYLNNDFQYLISQIMHLSKLNTNINRKHISLKIIADHIRSCSFLISDGVLPSNEGRGYILRKLIRRMMRYGKNIQLPLPCLYKLVEPLTIIMGTSYPALIKNRNYIQEILLQEENKFLYILNKGLKILYTIIQQSLDNKIISGNLAFELYDTYGFPIELTIDIAKENNISVDLYSFYKLMKQQSTLSKMNNKLFNNNNIIININNSTSVFCGYKLFSTSSYITNILYNQCDVNTIDEGQYGIIVLNKTPFYAESGGQVGDKGILTSYDKNSIFVVYDTQYYGNIIFHYGFLKQGIMQKNQKIIASININNRQEICINHTAIHLLYSAMKNIIRKDIEQKGSLISAQYSRFDFSCNNKIEEIQIYQIEDVVNNIIRSNVDVITNIITKNNINDSNLLNTYKKYNSDNIRILSISDFSVEPCCGTHVNKTGDIGLFKITNEFGIANGIRRIEIATGVHALKWINNKIKILNELSHIFKISHEDIPKQSIKLFKKIKDTKKQTNNLHLKLIENFVDNLIPNIENINNINVLIKQIDNIYKNRLKDIINKIKLKLSNIIVVLFTIFNDKMYVIVWIDKKILCSYSLKAIQLIKYFCNRYGGKEDIAQGGGYIPKNLNDTINKIKNIISSLNTYK